MAPDRLRNPTVYQVYPRSFQDTTGTGEGDLAGVLHRMDHIASLGVDAIWLSPFFPSPMADGGYDIVDHRAVDPRFGTLRDFDRIVEAATTRGLGVIVDLVLNHTSEEHPWFLAAIEGDEDAARRYVWRDAKQDGTPPNNWQSFVGPPAWTWNPRRGQYYFHQYLKEQPCLDVRNPEVQDDHRKTIEFWKDRGVSGFRLDVVTAYLFDESLSDNPPATAEVRERMDGPASRPYTFQDHVYDMLPGDGASYANKIRDWAGDDLWLVGECNTGNQSLKIAQDFTQPGRLDALYTTDVVECGSSAAVYPRIFEALEDRWCVPWWFSSHDQARAASAHGQGDARTARFLAALLTVLPGTLLLYQGDELGLPQPELSKDEIDDPFDLFFWPDGPGRSGARVPLPWSEDAPHHGFTDATAWLPMRWPEGASVDAQTNDSNSVLSFYRQALETRRRLGFADPMRVSAKSSDDLLTIETETSAGRFLVEANFGGTPIEKEVSGEIILTSSPAGNGVLEGKHVRIVRL